MRDDLWPEHEKMQKLSKPLQSLGDKLALSLKSANKLDKRNGQTRIEVEKLQGKIKEAQ